MGATNIDIPLTGKTPHTEKYNDTTISLSILPCQIPFCQTVHLPSVTRQQNVTKYWWEGSNSAVIPTTFTSDIVSQHNKIGGITFKAALVVYM